uniref:Uncharacterized protein n=1 Tax=Solanum tuberosum TaxID=4113 RepID=M1E197_SOLTU
MGTSLTFPTSTRRPGRVPLLDTDEVLPMDVPPPLHPILVRQGSTSRSKRRRTDRANNSQVATESEDEGSNATRLTGSQPPLSGERIEEDLAAVWRRLGCPDSGTTRIPPAPP